MVARIALTMACGPYDRMEALAQGLVQPEGIDLHYLAIPSLLAHDQESAF